MVHSPGAAVGVLIIRVWTEGDDPSAGLRARLVGRHDIEGEDADVATAATVDDAVEATRRWLEQFIDGQSAT